MDPYQTREWKVELRFGRRTFRHPAVSADGKPIALSVHSWTVQTCCQTIVIDTGAGNGKNRPLSPAAQPCFSNGCNPVLERLAAAWSQLGDVDFMLVTNLHVDRVGWNMVRNCERRVPTVPNAHHVFSEVEYRFYARKEHAQTPSAGACSESTQPIVEAGQALLIDAGHQQPLGRFIFHRNKGQSFARSVDRPHATPRLRFTSCVCVFIISPDFF